MKQRFTLTFEIILSNNQRAFFGVVEGLGKLNAQPECVIWSMMPGEAEARFWTRLELEPDALEPIMSFFRSFRYIRRIVVQNA